MFGLVRQSGGHVWVYSEPGRGTTFKIYLPHTTEADPVTPAPPVVARGILQRNGYRVLEARDGGDPLLVGEQHDGSIQLLLTDVVMPGMNGGELAERLSALRPDMRVLMSGYTGDAAVHQRLLSSGIALLQKAITPDRLLHKVREVLDAPAAS